MARIGSHGDGVAVHEGERLYVPLTVPGDRVLVRPGAARGDGRAVDVVEILGHGPGRAEPRCPHFGHCGGCSLQHLSDDVYVAWKRDRLRGALARAGLEPALILPLARTPVGGRRRATFTAVRPGRPGADCVLGFNVRRGHAVCDLAVCPVLDPRIVAALPSLRRLLADALSPGQRTSIMVSVQDSGLEVVLEFAEEPSLKLRELLARFSETADLARIAWRRPNASLCEPVAERRPVGAGTDSVRVAVPPGAFRQPSAHGEMHLIDAVRAGVAGASHIADLFAGIGTFALPLALAGARVHAVDADDKAMRALATAARSLSPKSTPPLSTEARDLFARPLWPEELLRFDAVVFDPPRAGARTQSEALALSTVPTVVAVSCNPDSFARDARALAGGGYRLQQVTPIDQFLWSPHLELVAVFQR